MSEWRSPDADLAAVYKAAGEPIRLRLLAMLAHGELCVCHLHGALDAPQSTVSRHLGVLRHAGLVRARREGSWVHYRLTEVAERWLAPVIAEWRADLALRGRCCALRGGDGAACGGGVDEVAAQGLLRSSEQGLAEPGLPERGLAEQGLLQPGDP